MDTISAQEKSQDHRVLRRRNSISTPFGAALTKLAAADQNSPSTILSSSDDLKLLSIKPAAHRYSSLKDLLPSMAAVNSPKPKSAFPGPDICIRNRLVKEAARAYLRPMSASPRSAAGNIFYRFWTRVAAVIDFLWRSVIRALDGAIRVVGTRSSGLQRSKMCLV